MSKRTESTIRRFTNEWLAEDYCRRRNCHRRRASDMLVIVDGPEDDFAVVDIRTAQDMDAGYRWVA